MAIAFARVSIHTRSKGHSALAASSYRAGVRLFDTRTGQTHDFSNRHDVAYAEILLPQHANNAFLDREHLWNTLESAEKRKDAQLCKDVVLALPKELNYEQQIELAKRFALTHFVSHGLPADITLHDHSDGNPHVHILIPTRRLEQNAFSKHKARDLNPAFAKGFVVEKDFWGEQWRDMQSAYFQEHNLDISVDLNHIVPERHQGKHRHSSNHYLSEENQLIDDVRREVARGRVGVFIKYLSTKHSVFIRRDVEKLLFKAFRDSSDPQEYLRVMERILGHKEIVFLGKNEHGHDSFTTRPQYRLEARLHKDVEALMASKKHGSATPVCSLAKQYKLSDEQHEALLHIVESPDISVVIGRPGTGKSYLLKPVKDYYEAQQQHIIGASLSGKVAKALQSETGIPSSTIASLIWQVSNDRLKLTDKHVLVIDEAGMVDVHNMTFLLRAARKAGSKVVLIGDPDQLKPIHKGEIFRGIAALTGYIELENIKRQQDAGDRQASRELAKGNIQAAMQHYHNKEGIVISENAMNNLINDWDKTLQTEAIRDTVLLAFSRKSVRELNTQARKRLQAQNKIGYENITFQGFEHELKVSTGDRLLFRENNKMLGLRNGDIGTVKQVNLSGYHVELNSGEHINVPKAYQAIDYGYALTVHKSQGMTTKHAKVLIDSKYWDRNLSFVAFTRHKESLKIYTDKMNHPTQNDLINTLSRRTTRDNVIDWPLDFAIRCGFNPDKLIGRALNQLAGAGHKIKQGFNTIVEYEACMGNTRTAFQEKQTPYPELTAFEMLIEKRQNLNGYFADKADKQLSREAKKILKNRALMQQLTHCSPDILKKINRYANSIQHKHLEVGDKW